MNTVYVNSNFNFYRYRVAAAKTISEKVQEDWQPPDVGTVHWDGKLMDTLKSAHNKEERLPVLVSG